jgi:hypothetical protein
MPTKKTILTNTNGGLAFFDLQQHEFHKQELLVHGSEYESGHIGSL